MPKKLEIEALVDSLATISDIMFKKLKCFQSSECEPTSRTFMNALNTLRKAGKIQRATGRTAAKKGK